MTLNLNNIIIVGGYYPVTLYLNEAVKIKHLHQLAAVNFEKSLLDGVISTTPNPPTFISAPYFPSYPKNCSLIFMKARKFLFENYRYIGVFYINLPFFKNIWKYFKLLCALKLSQRQIDADIVICNTLNLAQLAAVAFAASAEKCIKSVVIMDIPIFPGDSSCAYKFYINYVEWPLVKLLLCRFDYFIVATDNIQKFFNFPPNKVSLLDGIYSPLKEQGDTREIDVVEKLLSNINLPKILYSGSLDERYGIKVFIDSFHQDLSFNSVLIICGSGPLSKYIETISVKDSRIVYLGVLSVQTLRKIQSMVDLLINPRDGIDEYNLYSFPSKTLEYMASGTPVLMNKLPCLSADYHDLIYYRSPDETFLDAVKRVLSIPLAERERKALSAKEFVLSMKSAKMQMTRVFSEIKEKLSS